MIYTSNYYSCNLQDPGINFYSISGDRGKRANFKGQYYSKLAPKKSFWQIWHNNIGKVPDDENNRFYVREFYRQTLFGLCAEEVYEELNSPITILFCYEPHDQFCHRFIVSAWWEITIGEDVSEVVQQANGELRVVNRPTWIKPYLQTIM